MEDIQGVFNYVRKFLELWSSKLSASNFPTRAKWSLNSSAIFAGSVIEALLTETQLGTLEADFEGSRVRKISHVFFRVIMIFAKLLIVIKFFCSGFCFS